MIESPLIQEIVAEAQQAGRVKTICLVLEERFGAVTPTVTAGLEQVKDDEKPARLTRHAALCPGLQAFEDSLRQELPAPPPVSTRGSGGRPGRPLDIPRAGVPTFQTSENYAMTHDPTARGQNWAEEPGQGQPRPDRRTPPVEGQALVASLVSLMLGLLSLFLLLLAGIPALLLGLLSCAALTPCPIRGRRGLGETWPWAAWCWGWRGRYSVSSGWCPSCCCPLPRTVAAWPAPTILRQLGFAVLLYNDVNTGFPTAAMEPHADLAGFAPWRNPPYVKRLSWMVELLPYLGRTPEGEAGKGRNRRAVNAGKFQALYNRFDFQQPWDAAANAEPADTRIDLFVCPSHPRSQPQ